MSKVDCRDLDRVLRSEDPVLLEAIEGHAESCARCAQELRLWKTISAAARDMRQSWESPHLWPRIRQALAAESQTARSQISDSKSQRLRQPRWSPSTQWPAARSWHFAAALACLVFISASGVWLLLHRPASPLTADAQRRLLTERALREVEKSEAAYVDSIQKLSVLAGPKIANPKTPLLASYREKLLLLDAAIDECRGQVKRNRGNPQLRQELLVMYREKQQTLEELIREE